MAESELTEVNEEVTDVTEVTETTGNEPEEITWEQAMEWKKKAERLEKAEKALVDKKRAEKAEKKNENKSDSDSEAYITRQELAIERFLDKNPDFNEFKDDIVSYVKKGNSLEEAKILVENSETVKNRKKNDSLTISVGEPGGKITSFTKEALAKMGQAEYNRARDLMDAGKARLVK